MKWYLCWAAKSNFRTDHDWENLIRAALYSAKVNTTLEPVIVIDGEPSAFTDELAAAGVQVIFHTLSFRAALEQHYASHGQNLYIAIGAFLRFDIPLIENQAEYVLYTDCDVQFLKQPAFRPEQMPQYFAAAPQFLPDDYADMNTGVMLINVPNMRLIHAHLIAFACANLTLGLDQEVMRAAFGENYQHLPPELNWKPYWGLKQDAVILHWHGPKPVTIKKYLDDDAFSSHADWNSLFRRNPEGYLLSERLYADFLLGGQTAATNDDTRFLRIFSPGNEPFWGEYLAHLNVLNEILRQSDAPMEGSIFFVDQTKPGPLPDVRFLDKRRNFAYFANLGRSMLEIGFNAGHSALLALVANRRLSYVAVDDLTHGYARTCFAYLRGVFGERIKLFAGDSRNVLKAFQTDMNAFDLASVDGGHDFACVQSDLAEIRRVLPAGATVLVNDCDHAPVRAAVLAAIASKRLRQLTLPVPATDQVFLEVVKP